MTWVRRERTKRLVMYMFAEFFRLSVCFSDAYFMYILELLHQEYVFQIACFGNFLYGRGVERIAHVNSLFLVVISGLDSRQRWDLTRWDLTRWDSQMFLP